MATLITVANSGNDNFSNRVKKNVQFIMNTMTSYLFKWIVNIIIRKFRLVVFLFVTFGKQGRIKTCFCKNFYFY